jgi:hypothetical protein
MSRESLRKRSKGRCEIRISPDCSGKAEHEHHRYLRSQGGTGHVENIICVCAFCHNFIHAHVEVSEIMGWIVISWEDPVEKPWYPFNWFHSLIRGPRSGEPRVVEKSRNRAVWSMKVPKDERENGIEVFTSLLDQARERIAPVLNLQTDCPPYYILVAVLVDFLSRAK